MCKVYEELKRAFDEGTLVIYLDEVMFTLRSVNNKEFSNRLQNIEMDYKSINIKTTAVVAAIAHEHGVLYYRCFDRSVNIDKFKVFIDELR